MTSSQSMKMIVPTMGAMNGSSPRDAAYNTSNANATKLNNLNAVGGAQVVPSVPLTYSVNGSGNTQNPNATIKDLSVLTNQSNANAQYDNKVNVAKGGWRRRRTRVSRFKRKRYSHKKSKRRKSAKKHNKRRTRKSKI